MSRCVITPRGEIDLEDIGDYIAFHNPAAAVDVIDRLEDVSVSSATIRS